MRLFAALRPPLDVLDHLEQALQTVSPPWLGAGPPPLRWVTPEQRHVTLAFYGEVPDGAVEDLAGALTDVAGEYEPLRLQLAGAGIFSRATLWVGVRALEDDDALVRLMGDCGAAAEGVAHHEPRERSRAHLTVARLSARQHREEADRRRRSRRGENPRAPSTDLPALAHALSLYRGPEWRAEEIELVQSRLGAGRGGGPQHEVLATLPLGR